MIQWCLSEAKYLRILTDNNLINSHWAVRTRAGPSHPSVLRSLSKRQAPVSTSDVQRGAELHSQTVVELAQYGKHSSEGGNACAEDEAVYEVLQERVCAVESSAVRDPLQHDDDEDFAQSIDPVDSVLSSLWLWTFHRFDLLQLIQRRSANVWSPQVLHGRGFLRGLHADDGADFILWVRTRC